MTPENTDLQAAVERANREVARNEEEARMDDRAAAASKNPDGAATFRAWAYAKRERAADLRLILTTLAQSSASQERLEAERDEALMIAEGPSTLRELASCSIANVHGRHEAEARVGALVKAIKESLGEIRMAHDALNIVTTNRRRYGAVASKTLHAGHALAATEQRLRATLAEGGK